MSQLNPRRARESKMRTRGILFYWRVCRAAADEAGVAAYMTRVGSMMCTFFTNQDVTSYDTASSSDADVYSKYFWNMLDRGVYLAPSRLETGFVSLAHTEEDIDRTIESATESLKEIC